MPLNIAVSNSVVSQSFVSGGSSFSPSDISGLTVWLDAAFKTLNGSDVSQLNDLSGNGNHLVQATASDQPLWNSSDSNFNNLPSVSFDGINHSLEVATFVGGAITQPNTIFLIGKLDANVGLEFAFDGGNAGTDRHTLYTITSGVKPFAIGAPTELAGNTDPGLTVHILGLQFNTTSSNLYMDGGTVEASGDVGADDMNGIMMGARFSSTFNGEWTIAEILVYNSSLSDADMNLVGNYLASKYLATWTDI